MSYGVQLGGRARADADGRARGLDAERIRKTRSLFAPHVQREGGREGTRDTQT